MTTSDGSPHDVVASRAIPRLVARTSTILLPAGPVRDRYRLEHEAELDAQPPRIQYRYALGALTSSWALRRAVIQENDMSLVIKTSTPLLCRFNVRHQWQTESTPDGERFRRCRRCGKDDPGPTGDVNYAMRSSPL